ncbi:MAG TPA: phosphoribosylamine--glycine ligase [Acidimicrobiales bacterium]|nr:phosphoribosylamine--glycine ligase [Acidimicrobiales bacterium]
MAGPVMRVCVVGSGGREHALASALARDATVVVTPGNAGIPNSTPQPAEEIDADLFVIGPEDPLVAGVADRLRAQGKLCFGPGADGARLEGSKAWMKEVLDAAGVPTAGHASFTDLEPALAYLDTMAGFYVVKTDGLAAGKGVIVTESIAEARDAVRDYLSGAAFGDAGRRVVIEEGLTGPELSLLAICDGRKIAVLAPAQDFKRVGAGDVGPNTGGMGAYSPVPVAGSAVVDEAVSRAVEPTVHELRRRGVDYRGVLYAGIMLTPAGLKVLEYNVRFGDPETQVVVPRLSSSLTALLAEAAAGELRHDARFVDAAAVTVVCATEHYPARPRTGDRIRGLDAANAIEGVTVYCAGVRGAGPGDDDGLYTSGGRVLNVTAMGATIGEARERAYRAVRCISWPGMHYRADIAARV